MEKATSNLLHVAMIHTSSGLKYLFLRRLDKDHLAWFLEDERGELKTSLEARSLDDAMRIARKAWKNDSFNTIGCGYKFTLPERDEHGNNAFWRDMCLSLNSFNGVYYDEELGHNCIVNQIPLNSRLLYEKLKKENRL